MLSTKLKEAAGNGADATLYVDDVFSTYLYTGNGTTQTITNGIDLAGKGGMVWVKSRSAATDNKLTDTVRGATKAIISNSTALETTDTTGLTAFSSTGFSLGASSVYNTNAATYVSWTFRKAAKFFDVVTYTGNGGVQNIAHSLGVAPGMIIVKKTTDTGNWRVYSNGMTSADYSMQLNRTNAQTSDSTVWNSTAPTSSVFSVGTNTDVNDNSQVYVAYLFAHDTDADGIIQCGSSSTNSSGNDIVDLGFEPQWVMIKPIGSAGGDWEIRDIMRGFPHTNSGASLYPNLSSAEVSSGGFYMSDSIGGTNGFQLVGKFTSQAYIYMAIRRPNKPPTSGTQVFGLNARTGTGANATVTGGQTDDAVLIKNRGAAVADLFSSRLTGTGYLVTSSTAAEVAAGTTILQANPWDVMDGVKVGTTSTITNASANTFINYLFKRAPGFFDVVCYTGTGSATTQAHNLTVVPEIIIVKQRNNLNNWFTYFSPIGISYYVRLDLTNPAAGDSGTDWNTTLPTSTVFSIGTSVNVNASAQTYVAYLFATLAGIQYINSYVGDGTTGRVINCGFSAGARFICIKATSTTGSWWVWDSARGITSTNDPVLQLNSTAAEITSADAIDPSSSGFIVNQEATCSINASGVSYLVWAIA